ncbi:UNVERIFIED_CONTAM: hypothetical protein HHA_273310 [Hammondia hammondi]|eukprot:XP_008882633.1 hypothetical protein HHA_273310 [Hammondia hammondi]
MRFSPGTPLLASARGLKVDLVDWRRRQAPLPVSELEPPQLAENASTSPVTKTLSLRPPIWVDFRDRDDFVFSQLRETSAKRGRDDELCGRCDSRAERHRAASGVNLQAATGLLDQRSLLKNCSNARPPEKFVVSGCAHQSWRTAWICHHLQVNHDGLGTWGTVVPSLYWRVT